MGICREAVDIQVVLNNLLFALNFALCVYLCYIIRRIYPPFLPHVCLYI